MEQDKLFNGTVSVSIEGLDSIEFKRHSFYEVLEAFIEKRF